MTDYVNIPQLNIPMVDPNSGVLTTPWIRFFVALMNRTGGSVPDTPTDSALQAMMTDTSDQDERNRPFLWPTSLSDPSDGTSRAFIFGREVPESKSSFPWPFHFVSEGDASRSYEVQTVTVGASPYEYAATSNGGLIVSGGTVSAAEFSRDGSTFYSAGATSGVFPLRKHDTLRVTYTDAPTLTFVPM